MAFRHQTVTCSSCRLDLERVGRADCEFWRCVHCGGGWVDHETLTRMCAVMRWDARIELRDVQPYPGDVLTFTVRRDGEILAVQTLDQSIIKVGKLDSSHLRIDGPRVSRMHAVIERDSSGNLEIIDLGSAAGTLVNGKRINKAPLAPGDVLGIGDNDIELSLGPDMPALPEARPCPDCGEPLQPKRIDKVHVDACDEHGVWFDARELEQVLADLAGA